MNPQQTSSTSQQARESADRLKDQARDKTGEVVQKAQDTAKTTAAKQKGRAAEMVGSVADALHQTGRGLHDRDQGAIGNFVDQAAGRLDEFSNDLQNKSVDEIIGDVESFARREPGLFVGGAVVLGLLASRFFKASGRRQQQRQWQSYPGQRYYGARGYSQSDLADYRRQTLREEYAPGTTTTTGYTGTETSTGYSSHTGTTGAGSEETFGARYPEEEDYPSGQSGNRPSSPSSGTEGGNPPFSGPYRRDNG